MSLFSITSQCNVSSSPPGSGGVNITYDYGLRFTVLNSSYLRNNGGFGSFTNTNPSISPFDSSMTAISVTGDTGLLSSFDIEVYNNALLVYTLNKPAGTNFITSVSSLPTFGQFDQISVRISNITTQVINPKVNLTISEVT